MVNIALIAIFLIYSHTCHTFNVNNSQVPFHVAVVFEGRRICSGSLISRDLVLSAARCFPKDFIESKYAVRFSTNDPQQGESRAIKKIVIHETYDIALIRLGTNANLTDSVKPVYLDINEPKNGTLALATGWIDQIQPNLTAKGLVIISRSECLKFYSKDVIQDNVLCAEGECVEDLGGPLVIKWQLVGIFSWCHKDKPVVYTNVTAHVSWILEVIQKVYNSL